MNFEAYLDSLRGKSVAVIGIGVSQPAPDPPAAGPGHRRHRLGQKDREAWEPWGTSWTPTAAACSWGRTI